MINDVQYLYCINKSGEDFITTSYTYINSTITIYNFNQEIDFKNVDAVCIDYANDPFVSFNKRYTNSNALTCYKIEYVEQDEDRMTITIKIIEQIDKIDLQTYKRDTKIQSIIDDK